MRNRHLYNFLVTRWQARGIFRFLQKKIISMNIRKENNRSINFKCIYLSLKNIYLHVLSQEMKSTKSEHERQMHTLTKEKYKIKLPFYISNLNFQYFSFHKAFWDSNFKWDKYWCSISVTFFKQTLLPLKNCSESMEP